MMDTDESNGRVAHSILERASPIIPPLKLSCINSNNSQGNGQPSPVSQLNQNVQGLKMNSPEHSSRRRLFQSVEPYKKQDSPARRRVQRYNASRFSGTIEEDTRNLMESYKENEEPTITRGRTYSLSCSYEPIRDHDIRLQESMNCSPSKNDVMPIIREVENIEQPDPNAQHGESTKYNGIPVRQPIGGRRRFFFSINLLLIFLKLLKNGLKCKQIMLLNYLL